jgi:hypothetical protein
LALQVVAAQQAPAKLGETVESYFADLREDVVEVAETPAIKGTRLRSMDRYFVRALKSHQVWYSLIRTNSKGKVISEVIRGKTPEREFRDVSRQRWFVKVSRTHEGYNGWFKEGETGRYYLLWCEPVLKGRRFLGGVAVKVDIWDCFHDIGREVRYPFLVRFEGINLYEHIWESVDQWESEELEVPGADNVAIRYEEQPAEPIVADSAPAAAAGTDKASATGPAGASARAGKKSAKPDIGSILTNPVAVGIALVALGVVLVLVIRLYSQVQHIRLMRKIDKSDML